MKVKNILYWSFISMIPSLYSQIFNFNVTQYAGLWYQIFTTDTSFFKDYNTCITTEYSFTPSNQMLIKLRGVNIYNQFKEYNGHGWNPYNISSYYLIKYKTDAEIIQSNWILKLGPIIHDKYDYSIVSNCDKSSLHVLIRNPRRYLTSYRLEIEKYLNDHFKHVNYTKVCLV